MPTLDRAVDVADIVTTLKSYGLTHSDIGVATGAHPRSVANWKATSAIRPEYEDRLRKLQAVVLRLAPALRPRAVGQWLRLANPSLGARTPLSCLASGDHDAVMQAVADYVAEATTAS